MKIYLIRHADPDYSIDSLTEQGHREAQALVPYMEGEAIDRIVSSPMGRARATAEYTATALSLPVAVEPWMAELDLRSEMEDHRTSWDIHGHLIRNADYLSDTGDPGKIPFMPAAAIKRTVEDLRAGSDAFLAGLGYVREGGIYRAESPSSERIAVFAHGGFGLTWLSTLLEIPLPLMWSGFFLHPSSVTQILFDERTTGIATPRCIMISALPHLFAAGLPPGQAGIRGNYT